MRLWTYKSLLMIHFKEIHPTSFMTMIQGYRTRFIIFYWRTRGGKQKYTSTIYTEVDRNFAYALTTVLRFRSFIWLSHEDTPPKMQNFKVRMFYHLRTNHNMAVA